VVTAQSSDYSAFYDTLGAAAAAQTAAQAFTTSALVFYAPLASPAFTGAPTAPTPSTLDNSTNVATTAYVKAQDYVTAASSPVISVFGRTGAVTAQIGDYTYSQISGTPNLGLYALLSGAVFSGNVTLGAELIDSTTSPGTGGWVLSSTGSGVRWIAPWVALSSPIDQHLATAANYAILSANAVTSSGSPPTSIIAGGNLGSYPTATLSFAGTFVLPAALDDAHAQQAQIDAANAYAYFTGLTPTGALTTPLDGQTITTGVYNNVGSVILNANQTLTLNAQGNPGGTFVFQIGGNLTIGDDAKVVLSQGALAANVIWLVAGSITVGDNVATEVGDLFAQSNITLGATAILYGRAISMTGTVTLNDNNITAPVQGTFSGGTVTLVAGAGIATGIVTTTGSITVLGSGSTLVAATADPNLSTAVSGHVVTTDGSGNVQDSGAALAQTFTPIAGEFVTGYNTTTGLFTAGTPAYPVTSVFGRTGAVVAVSGDYTVAQVTGAAPLASPTFTGVPVAPTAPPLTNNTQIATTAYVDTAAALLVPISTITGAGNQVLATSSGGGAAVLQALTQSMMPSQFSAYANLPNVKFYPIKVQPGFTSAIFDYYTVPAGRRAMLGVLDVTQNAQQTNAINFTSMVKIGGIYCPLSSLQTLTGQQTLGFDTVGYIAEAGEGFSMLQGPPGSGGGSDFTQSVVTTVGALLTVGPFTLTSVFATGNGFTDYVGTITGGSGNLFIGDIFVVTGFTNAGNNGTFLCVASTTTTLTLQNIGGVAETHAGSAVAKTSLYTWQGNAVGNAGWYLVTGCTSAANNGLFFSPGTGTNQGALLANPNAVAESESPQTAFMQSVGPYMLDAWIVEFDNTAALKSVKLTNPTPFVANTLYTPSGSKNGLLVGVGNMAAVTNIVGAFANANNSTAQVSLYNVKGGSASYTLTSASTAANGLTYYAGTIGVGGGPVFAATAITPVNAPFSLTSVTTSAGTNATYTGTGFTTSGYAGLRFTIAGFTNALNNGTFLVVSSTSTTILVENPYAVAETHAATATPSTLCTLYQTAAGIAGQSVGEYVTVVGATNAANNGTFLCINEQISFIALANANGVTAAGQQATLFINPLYGQSVTVSGFSNAGNNGTFTVASSTPQSLILNNSGGVAETHAGTVVITNIACPANSEITVSTGEGTVITITSGTTAAGGITSVGNGDSIIAIPSEPFTAMWAGRLNSIIWLNVVEF
jgi:hypothetical protein